MTGANRGKPKPASDRKHDVAASAIKNKKYKCVGNMLLKREKKIGSSVAPEAACNVKASMI